MVKCKASITRTFEEIVQALAARKQALLDQLESIAAQKVAALNQKYEETEANSVITKNVE